MEEAMTRAGDSVPESENRALPQRPLVRRKWKNGPECRAKGRPISERASEAVARAK